MPIPHFKPKKIKEYQIPKIDLYCICLHLNTDIFSDVKTLTTTTFKNDSNEYLLLRIFGISIATSVPMLVLSILVSILFSR